MASAKKAAPPKKSPPQAAPKAAATSPKGPAKAPAKPQEKVTSKPTPPAPLGKPLPASAGAKVHAADEETPAVVPKLKLEKHAGKDTLCQIEIVKDGHFFIARTVTEGGAAKEYKNTVFEDLLTEMVITLQEQLSDK